MENKEMEFEDIELKLRPILKSFYNQIQTNTKDIQTIKEKLNGGSKW